MKHVSLAIAALGAAIGFPVFAADMPLKAPIVPVPVVYNWTGCYIGGHGGGLWVHKDWTDVTLGGNAPFGGHDGQGWLAGGQIGCNYQIDRWVFGLQGDYAWTDVKASNVNLVQPLFTDHSQVKSLGSVTGRIGYAWDRLLGYVKGGWAWERDDYFIDNNTAFFAGPIFVAPGTLLFSGSETRGGWTVGIGAEYAFDARWSVFVEYNHYDFGTHTVRFTNLTTPGLFIDEDIRERKDTVKVGINFRFVGR